MKNWTLEHLEDVETTATDLAIILEDLHKIFDKMLKQDVDPKELKCIKQIISKIKKIDLKSPYVFILDHIKERY